MSFQPADLAADTRTMNSTPPAWQALADLLRRLGLLPPEPKVVIARVPRRVPLPPRR